jgi:hypothetical protein
MAEPFPNRAASGNLVGDHPDPVAESGTLTAGLEVRTNAEDGPYKSLLGATRAQMPVIERDRRWLRALALAHLCRYGILGRCRRRDVNPHTCWLDRELH